MTLRLNTFVFFVCSFFTGIVFPYTSYAQQSAAYLHVDTNSIFIGQQIKANLQINVPKNSIVQWPTIPDSIQKLEVVRKENIDTLLEGDRIQYSQTIYLTSFDSGYHSIDPFIFLISNDNIIDSSFTNNFLLEVKMVDVDTTAAIKDIKPIEEIPLTLKDFIPYILVGLLVMLIAIGLWYLIKYLKKKKLQPTITIPSIKPHDWALQQLTILKKEELWQKGQYKEYHTRVSEIVRWFIENQWHIPALEQTSHEIISSVRDGRMCDTRNLELLEYVLNTADIVKFAKSIPVAHENEQCMTYAIDFVSSFTNEMLEITGGDSK